jgi:hypothetical protein
MFCSQCGQPLSPAAKFCGACGTAVVAPAPSAAPDPALRFVVPIGRSGLSILAGYLGLFSPLVVFAPFALVCGVLALRELRRRPELLGRGRAWFGAIAGALFTALGAAVLIAALAR